MGTPFGIGSPYPVQANVNPWGFSPYFGQTIGAYPPIAQPYGQPLQQILQSLQIVPYQLQQLQQLVQLVPAQLQQLQQLIQFIPQQIQQLQQQAQVSQFGAAPFLPQSGFSAPFGGQQTHVM